MTSRELAKLLGFSPATVSMALNGKPGVNEETRKTVLAAAKTYHVTPRALSSSSRPLYLLDFKRRENSVSSITFTGEVIQGIKETCTQAGYPLLTRAVFGMDALIDAFHELPYSDTAGILLLGMELVQEDFSILPRIGIPVVLIDNHAFSSPIDCVKIDNLTSTFTAVNFLVSRTHSQPGYLKSSYYINNFAEREQGFYQALKYNSLSRSSLIVHPLLPSIESAYAEMSDILKSGQRLASCYFADDDLIAIGAMKAMVDFGIRVPEEISVIGFDDIALSAHTSPPLTTMHVPKYHFGQTAVKRMLTLLQDNSSFPVNMEMPASLIVRKSIR